MTFVLGDSTTTYESNANVNAGKLQSFGYVAPTDGVIRQLRFYTSPDLPSTATSVTLCVYSDNAGMIDDLLGSGNTSVVPQGDWIDVTGLNVPVTSGTLYYLAAMAIGGTVYYKFHVDLDEFGDPIITSGGYRADDTYTSPPDPWPPTETGTMISNQVGFEALGDVGPGAVSDATGLEFHLTGLIGGTTASPTPPPYYGRIADPQAGEVVIPLNDSRTASVTVSVFDPVVETLAAAVASNDLHQIPYETHLKVYYNGLLVFWGPIKVRSADLAAGTVRFDAVDLSLRLIKHFVREGDPLLAGGTVDNVTGDGYLPISHEGLRLLRDAGDTVSFPPLGIDDGTNDFTPDPNAIIDVHRGDQVWSTMQRIQQALGPDFELEPREAGDGFYCQLNTYTHQGTDISALTQLHYGTGHQNLEALSFVEGEEYSNLVHVFDRDLKYHRHRADATALGRTGPYITWDATDYSVNHASVSDADAEAVLDAAGDDILSAYGVPLLALSLTLPVDTRDGLHYFIDYKVGDLVGVAAKAGFILLPEASYRITRVTISQDGESVRQALEVVAVGADELGGSDT